MSFSGSQLVKEKKYLHIRNKVPGVVGKSGEVILIGAGLKEAKKKKRGLAETTKWLVASSLINQFLVHSDNQ